MTAAIVQPVNPVRRPASVRQLQLFHFIAQQLRVEQQAPSIPEMATALGVSKSRAFQILNALERKGWIVRDAMKSRAIRIQRYGDQ